MNIVKLFLATLIFSHLTLSQKLEGKYLIGDVKAEIKIKNNHYRLFTEDPNTSSRLRYNQNTILNEQIWDEIRKGVIVGSLRFSSDYKTGTYVRKSDIMEFKIVRLE
jgi:hypothetical protein